MTGITKITLRNAVAALLAASLLAFVGAEAASQAKPLQIGMAKSFLYERTKGFVEIAMDDFKDVMKTSTGMDGVLNTKFGPGEIAEKLESKQLDLGIFHAHEFAWVQKKYPDLQPLLIAANKGRLERAYVIVNQKSAAKTLADLRGKKLDMPAGTKEHCRVYVEKQCGDKAPAAFFSAIEKSSAPADALDNVARGKVDAAVIDSVALEFYKEVRGPVFEKNLKVLQQSETFPPAVVVYKTSGLDDATRNQFRDGLLKAHTIDKGRDMMKTWNIDAFEAVPKDYTQALAELLKRYPAPASLR
jgi:ABC-type phosphate/phosphonate transport system substrate-binding protein